jgi:hypothetical protein
MVLAEMLPEELARIITEYDLFTQQEKAQLLMSMLSKARNYWCAVVRCVLEHDTNLAKDLSLLSQYFRKWLSTGTALWDILTELQSKNSLIHQFDTNYEFRDILQNIAK